MSKEKVRRGVSRAEWLEAALDLLREHSIENLTIEGIARALGISKAGFYWHFENRADLLRQLLDFWTHEMTEVIAKNPQVLELAPADRLMRIAEMVLEYDLTRHEIPIRQWALQDKEAARAVRKVNRTRLATVGDAFAELGFEGDELEMRTRLFVCFHSLEGPMFPEMSRKRRRKLVASRIELLTSR